jgi:uncharacterized SAM-binding protein YcdF (DUF218 family)
MFFILSKTLNFFIQPFNLILLFLALSFIVRKKPWKRWLRLLSLGLFLFFSNGLIFNALLGMWEVPAVAIDSLPGQYQVGIVLGGTTDTEREPKDRLFFRKGADRVTHALHLYHAGKIRKILFTGGNPRLFDEPEKDNRPIYDFYVMCGVQPEDIIIENRSRNTHENALYAKALMEEAGIEGRAILITSAFHMRRSMATFEQAGLQVTAFSGDFNTALPEDRLSFSAFFPSAVVLHQWNMFIKELIGYAAYDLAGYL